MIKYITNPIHSLTQSYTAATITSLLTQQPRTGTSQPVPPGPSSVVNDCTWHRKASAIHSRKLNKFLHSEVNLLIHHMLRSLVDHRMDCCMFVLCKTVTVVVHFLYILNVCMLSVFVIVRSRKFISLLTSVSNVKCNFGSNL